MKYLSFMIMRFRFLSLVPVILLFITLKSFSQTYERDFQDGQLFVKFVDEYDPLIPVADDFSVRKEDAVFFADIKDKFVLESITRPLDLNNDIKLLRTFHLKFASHHVLDEVIEILEKKPEIEYAEKVAMYYIDYTPNDSLYNLINGTFNWKWHLDVINAEMAWDITQGSPDIKVGVIDNAVWTQHPDLQGKIVAQRDVVYGIDNANPPTTGDPGAWSHGTHVSGLVSAMTDNDIGVAGIGFNTSIIAVKASPNNSPDGITHSYQGVAWAINNGATIINMSFGGTGYNATFQNLVISGHNMGVSFIASAGNDNVSSPHYPSAYQHVISVASTNNNDAKSDFSNYGTTIDVSAPGGYGSPGPAGLLSTTYEQTNMGYYSSYFGTSMSSPVTAGLASLMKSINPSLTPSDLEAVLKATCDNIDAQNPNYIGLLGAGRINAYEAVKAVPFSPVSSFETAVTVIMPGQTVGFYDLSAGVPSSWNWSFPGATPSSSTLQHPAGIAYNTPGVYDVSLTVQNAYGSHSMTINGYIEVTSTPSPYLQFTVSESEACIYDPVFINDNTLYDPVSWNWEFSPNSYQFINGTTANSQNPELIFTMPGTYSLTVTVGNSNGNTTKEYEDIIIMAGMVIPSALDFETGSEFPLHLSSNSKATIKIDKRSAHDSDFGLHFTGGNTPSGWSGTPTGTTPTQAWEQNIDFHANAFICNLDGTGYQDIDLFFDLRQTFSMGVKTSWFRVLVNDSIHIADVEGVMDFNPMTNEDPFVQKHFDLSQFAGTVFSLRFQSACRLYDYFYAEGDNVFIDNIEITGTPVGTEEIVKIASNDLLVFPNPARDLLYYSYPAAKNDIFQVSFTSLDGKLMYEDMIEMKQGINRGMIPVNSFSPGVYLLKLMSFDDVILKKVVVR